MPLALARIEFYNAAMKAEHSFKCDCCSNELSRREFLKTTVTGVAALAAVNPLTGMAAQPQPAKTIANRVGTPETLVGTLYKSVGEEQKKAICFPFDHPLRSKVDNNWFITDKKIGSNFFTADQQQMVREIFHDLHSPEYADVVYKQVEHDSGKEGFGTCAIALFGNPGTGKFEFVLTGRHCTRRCDGDSVQGAAFGGPIFYGHAAKSNNEPADHPGNAYWYQAKRANEVFRCSTASSAKSRCSMNRARKRAPRP